MLIHPHEGNRTRPVPPLHRGNEGRKFKADHVGSRPGMQKDISSKQAVGLTPRALAAFLL